MHIHVSLFEGQICQRCKQPIGRHTFTGLGAIKCLDMPANSGLTPWFAHKFATLDGKSYMSILEEVGMLAGMLEERGLPSAYEPAMEIIHRLVARLSSCAPGDVRPYKEWFKLEKPKQEKTDEATPLS